jgi:hypothetical protein
MKIILGSVVTADILLLSLPEEQALRILPRKTMTRNDFINLF